MFLAGMSFPVIHTVDNRVFPNLPTTQKLAFLPTVSFLFFSFVKFIIVIHKFGGKCYLILKLIIMY